MVDRKKDMLLVGGENVYTTEASAAGVEHMDGTGSEQSSYSHRHAVHSPMFAFTYVRLRLCCTCILQCTKLRFSASTTA